MLARMLAHLPHAVNNEAAPGTHGTVSAVVLGPLKGPLKGPLEGGELKKNPEFWIFDVFVEKLIL